MKIYDKTVDSTGKKNLLDNNKITIVLRLSVILQMGPFQGMSETASAAEAPLMLSISGS